MFGLTSYFRRLRPGGVPFEPPWWFCECGMPTLKMARRWRDPFNPGKDFYRVYCPSFGCGYRTKAHEGMTEHEAIHEHLRRRQSPLPYHYYTPIFLGDFS